MAISIFIILDNANIRSTRGSRHDPPIRRVLALLFAGAFSAVARGETELTVQLTQISEQKAVFASVESVDVTRARARIAGLVRDLVVDEGSLVKRGQRLALVVDAKLKLGLAALDARLASLAARRGLAETALKRARRLHRSGNVSQARLDEAVANLDALKADTAAQQAERAVLVQRRTEGCGAGAGRRPRAARGADQRQRRHARSRSASGCPNRSSRRGPGY